ncbi:hypothetical protein GCM10027051_13500 [Niabella terrae]
MKKIRFNNKSLLQLTVALLTLLLATGCSKMNDSYKEFLGDGPIKYVGIPDSVYVHPGYKRIQLTWRKPTDAKVKGGVIYWNNRSDSAKVAISPETDTVRIVLTDMAEGEYVFEVFSSDVSGKLSLSKEVVARVYGDNYAASLLSRPLDTAYYLGKDTLQIDWGGLPDTSIIGTEISYTDKQGVAHSAIIGDSIQNSFLYDFNGGIIHYRTIYLPERKSIDTFYTALDSVIVGKQVERTPVSRAGWSIIGSSFDQRSGSRYRPPEYLLDDDLSTYWVNSISPQTDYPHWVKVDMGAIVSDIQGFTTIQRKEKTNLVRTVEIYTSETNEDDSWVLLGSYILTNTVSFQDYLPLSTPISTRYFMMRVLDDYGSSMNVCLAEIGAFKFE